MIPMLWFLPYVYMHLYIFSFSLFLAMFVSLLFFGGKATGIAMPVYSLSFTHSFALSPSHSLTRLLSPSPSACATLALQTRLLVLRVGLHAQTVLTSAISHGRTSEGTTATLLLMLLTLLTLILGGGATSSSSPCIATVLMVFDSVWYRYWFKLPPSSSIYTARNAFFFFLLMFCSVFPGIVFWSFWWIWPQSTVSCRRFDCSSHRHHRLLLLIRRCVRNTYDVSTRE